MKHKGIRMKWKVFFYLLGFTCTLLVILWLFQICYLDTFYKQIKTNEAEHAMEQVLAILESDSEQISDEIDYLAAEYNLGILVVDQEGMVSYSAEYLPNSRMNMIPQREFQLYYQRALENGGSAKIEFEGGENLTLPQTREEVPVEDRVQRFPGSDITDISGTSQESQGATSGMSLPQEGHLIQNHGQDWVESVIYVQIVEMADVTQVVLINSQLTPVDATVSTLQTQLVWISILMLLLSLLISLLLSRKMTKPIAEINETAKELAKGDYHVAFQGEDYREVAELSGTLNYTARELEKTESLRRELIANVSHDLRTPLTMIVAYAEVMRDLPGENTPENVQVIIDEARRLTSLVNDMLDISKLQSGVVEQKDTVFNLTESIHQVLNRYGKLVEQDGYDISFDYDEEVYVRGDEDKLTQVIYNLVNNAINYTGEDKRVVVRQIKKDNQVRIQIIDTGEGIRQDEIPHVWERYYRAKKSHKRAVTGTGLGLSIVKNILLLHQAAFGVDSQPGQGSVFWFQLTAVPWEHNPDDLEHCDKQDA